MEETGKVPLGEPWKSPGDNSVKDWGGGGGARSSKGVVEEGSSGKGKPEL